MKIFVKGFVKNVKKFVNVLSALSDEHEVSENCQFYTSEEYNDDTTIVSAIEVDDSDLPWNFFDDDLLNSLSSICGIKFLTVL